MANRKVLIESILGLAQKIGANPNKFMGTKSNINFLGTGDKGMKGTTFSGQLNDDFLNLGFGKDDMIKIIEQDAGYVTAGKLNDVQLNTMFNNLKMIDETFSPPPGPMNVIDLETGTRNINKEGLESLRETDQIKRFTQGLGTSKTAMTNKIKEGIETLKTKFRGSGKAADEVQDIVDQKFGKGYFDDVATKAKSEEDFIRSGAADFGDSIAAEGGRRAVVRQVMKNNANYFGLPPEMAESIAKSKDLGKGGSNFPDPLIVFRDKGNFTRQELEQIDAIIEANPFDDVKNIADKVSDYVQSIRPDGFAEGGSVTTPKRGLVNEAGSYAGNRRKNERPSDVVDSRLLDIGFDNMSSEEIRDLIKAASTYKTGGRVGFKSGKSVKDGIAALLKLGNKKFGKDTLKTADEIEPSEFAKFNERNKVLDDLDIEDYEGELGDPETWYTFGMTVREADELVKARKAYQAQMFVDYKAGRLDPKPGEKGRKRFLEKKMEEADIAGDNKLVTLEEIDELNALQGGSGRPPGFVPRGLRNVPVEMMTARIIRAKYPQIPDEMVEQIASLPNDKKALALADLEQAIMLQESGRSSDEIIEIMKREPKTKMKKGGLAQILEM